MKKKILSVVAAAAALSAIALVGCGDGHTHKYEWKYKDGNHWQECECGHKTAEVPHEDKKNNATGEAGKDELCDVCGADLHVHAPQWTSDAVEHWQECVCGKYEAVKVKHVDEKNNETDAEGADGLCDVCARNIYAVTFDMKGHGVAPATQHVGKDGHAQAPEAPADEDAYKFGGWYKDSDFTTEYKFAEEAVTAPTTVYAKWTEDKTPGASKKYAYALTLEQENLKPAKVGEAVYYSYKATESGRYTISLFGLNTPNGTYTTNLTGETVYGKDCDLEEVTVDIDNGQTLYILYTYKGEAGNDITVSPLVTNVDDEPLPAGVFPDGEYSDGTHSLEFTNEGKKVKYDDTDYVAKYIGGKYKTLTFIKVVTISGTTYNETYTLTPNDNGTYTFKVSSKGANGSYTLTYTEKQNPVALSKLVGYYEPKADDYNGIKELYIYASESENGTSIIYKEEGYNQGVHFIRYSDLKDASYDTTKNRLTVGADLSATLKLGANDVVESLLIGGKEYVKKGEAGAIPPARLPLSNTDTEYTGATHKIRVYTGSQFFGETGYNSITVIGYVQATGLYTVKANVNNDFETYYLKVSDDNKTVTLYQEDGTTVVDTLTAFEWDIYDLPTQAATDNVTADGFQKNLRLYKASEAGWYSFTIPDGAVGYKNLNPNDYTNLESAVVLQSGATVYLKVNELIAVYMETPAAISVSVTPEDSPAGLSESNPKALVNGTATLDIAPADLTDPDNPVYQECFFSYTAPAAGTYLVKAVYNGMLACGTFIINGEERYASWNDDWTEILGVPVDLDAGDDLQIALQSDMDWEYVTVTVVEDITADAFDLMLDGTAQNDILTVSAQADIGANYHLDTKGEDVTVTGSAAFSILTQTGEVIEAEESEGVYTAVISAGNDVYFKFQSATQQTLTLTQEFEKGSEGYPVEIELENGTKEIEVEKGESVCFTLAPGVYSFNASVNRLYVYLNGEDVNNDTPIVVKDGDVLMYTLPAWTDYESGTLTISEAELPEVPVAVDVYLGNVGGVVTKFEINGDSVTLSYNTGEWEQAAKDVTPDKNVDGSYTFEYGFGWDATTVTYTINGNTITLTDSWYGNGTLINLDGVYEGEISETPSKIEIIGGKATYTYGDELMVTNAEIEATNDGYKFSYNSDGMNCDVELTVNGDAIEVDDFGLTGTLIKKADPVGTVNNPEVVEFEGSSVTVKVPTSGEETIEYYIQLPGGTYSIEDSSYGYDYELKIVADGEVENLTNMTGEFRFFVLDGDLLVVVNYSESEDITITVVDN